MFAVSVADVFAVSVADEIVAAATAFDAVAVADVDVDVIDVIGDVIGAVVAETDGILLENVTEPAVLIMFITGAAAPIDPIAPGGPIIGTILPCPSGGGTFLPAGVPSGPPC